MCIGIKQCRGRCAEDLVDLIMEILRSIVEKAVALGDDGARFEREMIAKIVGFIGDNCPTEKKAMQLLDKKLSSLCPEDVERLQISCSMHLVMHLGPYNLV